MPPSATLLLKKAASAKPSGLGVGLAITKRLCGPSYRAIISVELSLSNLLAASSCSPKIKYSVNRYFVVGH